MNEKISVDNLATGNDPGSQIQSSGFTHRLSTTFFIMLFG